MPRHKIFCSCTTSSIKHLIWIYSHDQLRVAKQMRDILFTPIAYILINTFHNIYARLFALNNNQRNTINKHNNIRTSKLPVWALHFKFIRYLKRIIFRMFKINIPNVKRLSCAIWQLFFQAFAATKQVIAFLIRCVEARCIMLVYRLNCFGDGSA